jgi:hypothetical protein
MFTKLKPILLIGLPLGCISYGYYYTKKQIDDIFNPLFKEEFDLHKKSPNNFASNEIKNDEYINFLEKFSENNKKFSPNLSQNVDRVQLTNHIKFITEWLYEPLDEDFENKMYFIENSEKQLEDYFRKADDNQYHGLRYKKL